MVATSLRTRLSGALLIPLVVTLAGVGVAVGIATAPSATLDAAMARSGLPQLLSAAEPPVGLTGRIVLALAAGGLIAALGWSRLLLSLRPTRARVKADMPSVRRADAHPDAPPRRPIRAAADLGAPLPIASTDQPDDTVAPALRTPGALTRVEPLPVPPPVGDPGPPPPLFTMARSTALSGGAPVVIVAAPPPAPPPPERALPTDLEQPLSAFDPAAVPATPMVPTPAVAPLVSARPAMAGERIETFELTPLRRAPYRHDAADAPERRSSNDDTPIAKAAVAAAVVETGTAEDDSIAALLARLERGTVARRQPATPPAAPMPAPVAATPTPVAESAPPPAQTLDDTLQRLRRLATG